MSDSERRSKKPNPFAPGKRLTRPELFAGRSPQLKDGVDLLHLAAAGNARHGLITGDRGIGKSSLASQIEGIARAEPEHLALLDKSDPDPPVLLVGEHIAQRGEGVPDVTRGLLDSLAREQRRPHRKIEWDLELGWGPFKARVKQSAGDPREATVGFVDSLEAIWREIEGKCNGILLVIDEMDRVAESPGVPTFFKVATEMMTARGLENIALLPVGMIGVQELLKAEHESVGRVFEVIHVPLLIEAEAVEILKRALAKTDVDITDEACSMIAFYADGFPHPVQVLGSEAYDLDTDDLIADDDVLDAIGSAIASKWRHEFDASLIAAGSGKNREILNAMAAFDGTDVPMSFVCERLGVRQPEISSNVNSLMKRDVIVRVDRGVYRFKERLFRIYMRVMASSEVRPVEVRPRKRKS